ncbi:unnamed protein product [Allacma fusca]|uniref:Uncharacterized protein n=1 Tax=Allacma fusca TaxID=39272 RepID=A0A8J2K2Q4_9HEXA|nr:unnamed protein product [Allacma fusca]
MDRCTVAVINEWMRFYETIPADHRIKCVVTGGTGKKRLSGRIFAKWPVVDKRKLEYVIADRKSSRATRDKGGWKKMIDVVGGVTGFRQVEVQ